MDKQALCSHSSGWINWGPGKIICMPKVFKVNQNFYNCFTSIFCLILSMVWSENMVCMTSSKFVETCFLANFYICPKWPSKDCVFFNCWLQKSVFICSNLLTVLFKCSVSLLIIIVCLAKDHNMMDDLSLSCQSFINFCFVKSMNSRMVKIEVFIY